MLDQTITAPIRHFSLQLILSHLHTLYYWSRKITIAHVLHHILFQFSVPLENWAVVHELYKICENLSVCVCACVWKCVPMYVYSGFNVCALVWEDSTLSRQWQSQLTFMIFNCRGIWHVQHAHGPSVYNHFVWVGNMFDTLPQNHPFVWVGKMFDTLDQNHHFVRVG